MKHSYLTRRNRTAGLITCLVVAILSVSGVLSAAPGNRSVGKVNLKLVSVTAGDAFQNPEYATDGKPTTEFTFNWGNGGAKLLFDLGQPTVVERVDITIGPGAAPFYVDEISVGPDTANMRDLFSRPINLFRGSGQKTAVGVPPSVGRYLRVGLRAGDKVGVGEIEVFGKRHRPERHLCHWWGGDVKSDFVDAMDYIDRDLGATDIWIDKLATAFPSTRPNLGFGVLEKAGVFKELKKRGINYWLMEDEGFGALVNSPADLRDDLKWETTLRRAREIYSQAKKLGFRGLVMDAEDYIIPSDPAIVEKYLKVADHIDCWVFNDEFGYAGYYYQRGLQYGKVIKEVWGCPVFQFYEAVMYAGIPGCTDGNYWWMKGIHDAGLEIWQGTEKSYGRGNKELYDPAVAYPEWTTYSFIDLPAFINKVHKVYPFADRVLPGFHPWIAGFGGGVPLYLPKYLDEQLSIVENAAFGCWIYHGSTARGGDPRLVLNKEFLAKHKLSAQDYVDVFRKHPTSRLRK